MQIFINKVLHDASKPAESRQECLVYYLLLFMCKILLSLVENNNFYLQGKESIALINVH